MVESKPLTFNECMKLFRHEENSDRFNAEIIENKFGIEIGYMFACMYCGKYSLDRSLNQCSSCEFFACASC
jgi:hypothetical protein